MHILVTNDDGPPSYQSSPYIQSLVSTLEAAGHTVSVVLPHIQRSWIGKAHMVGQTLTPSYYRPGSMLKDDGTTQDRPFNDGKEEWVLLDGTPASCVQIGLHYLFNDRGPIDLVISGPNYGRNTTAVFALSSGTIGGAMEGAHSGKKSIALSFAFDSRDHDSEVIGGSSRVSVQLIEKLVREWPDDVHLYSINVPVRKDVEHSKIVYTDMLQNQWTSGSSFAVLPENATDADPNVEELKIRDRDQKIESDKNVHPKRDHVTFKWAPNFADVRKSVEDAQRGDGWHVIQGHVTVTPLKANFWHLPHYTGEIKLDNLDTNDHLPSLQVFAVVNYPEPYVQHLISEALSRSTSIQFQLLPSIKDIADPSTPILQFTAYEALDFDHGLQNSKTSLLCAYVIRKALIRKHFLSNTVSSWIVKHPDSILTKHVKSSIHFELDYAEFLDEALVDAWDLHESMTRNQNRDTSLPLEWWILKPGMSDGGNGIRLFSSLEQLQTIFEEWDPESDNEEEDTQINAVESEIYDGTMTSQLRHFLVQPYIGSPLLLSTYENRKFHIRTYVVAVGALKVYVYKDMLALFAAQPYKVLNDDSLSTINLGQHLTNTCFQNEFTRASSVHRFWDLHDKNLTAVQQESVFEQICEATGEIFEAAAREQMVHFQVIPNAFEIFGLDFLVDASHNVWLLEVNAYPDFKQTGEDLQSVILGLFEESVKVAIEPFFGCRRHEYGSPALRLVKDIDLGRR